MNYPTNAVINSVPAASELRKVAGFNPLKFLRRTTSERTGEKVLKLDLAYMDLRINSKTVPMRCQFYANKEN